MAIVFATLLFYFIDRHWYHRLLVGSVKNAIEIENALQGHVVGIGLSKMIGVSSPLDVSAGRSWGWYVLGRLFGSDPRVKTDKKIHSDAKISIFYKSVLWFFLVVLLASCIFGIHGKPG